ncbi:hypothetical protein MAE_17340 [Microcystis aeruginosa NIES-843]|uniref:Uncharacterized protein n=1 Tax=Microcystis aeruginosa (strain NIES-843 / IAM M-2473) TaxID=449447 RepID=B0JW76_MICAN|nr:hypothetical protein MAE_17340 [Microcystis aeruginosa NIES-843]
MADSIFLYSWQASYSHLPPPLPPPTSGGSGGQGGGGESGLWVFSGDIENLSCLVEQGISDSDRSRIPRHSVA